MMPIWGEGMNRVVVGRAKVGVIFDGCKTIFIFAQINGDFSHQ
jgi:hypothetical protein